VNAVNKYEAMYIINPNVEDEARAALVERFSGLVVQSGGNVEKIDDWGKRKLAYEIQDLTEGHYILMHFEADSELPRELERNFKINEPILRYLVIRKDA
jgi:small subunit ribosomal protein S6